MLRGGECDGLSFERKSASCLVPPVTDFSTRSDRLWSQVHRCETGPTSTRSFFFLVRKINFHLTAGELTVADTVTILNTTFMLITFDTH